MICVLKAKLRQLKLRLRDISFSCFKTKINIKVSKIPESERIIWLLNKLMNESESQGISFETSVCSTMQHASIYWHKNMKNGLKIEVLNNSKEISVRGERDLTIWKYYRKWGGLSD